MSQNQQQQQVMPIDLRPPSIVNGNEIDSDLNNF